MQILRDQVADAIERRSLRSVARDVGLSPSGLQKFAEGAAPYRNTRRKLTEWFTRQAQPIARGTVSTEAALAALDLLLHDLPRRRRSLTREEIIVQLRTAYEQTGTPLPEWLSREP